MNLHDFLNAEIRIINRTLAAHGVDAGTTPAGTLIAGRNFISYTIRRGHGVPVAAVSRLQRELDEAISGHRRAPTPVRIHYMPLSLEVLHPQPAPLPWTSAGLDLAPHALLVGRSYGYDGPRDQVVRLDETPHILIGGMTGAGKSILLQMSLLTLLRNTPADQVRLVAIDLKNEDLRPFAKLPHTATFAGSIEAAASAIAAVYAELERRIAHPGAGGPRIVVAIDEYAQLIDERDTIRALERITSVGRSLRINVVAATQHPTAKVLGTLAKVNFTTRLIGRVADAQTSANATGRPGAGAEQLPGRGAFLRVEGADTTRLQAYYLDSTGLRALRHEAARHQPPAPAAASPSVSTVPGPAIPPALLEVFAAYHDGDGSLRRGGLAAALRALCGPDAPTAGRAYQEASQQIQAHLAAWHTFHHTTADPSEDASAESSRKTSPLPSPRGQRTAIVIRGSLPPGIVA